MNFFQMPIEQKNKFIVEHEKAYAEFIRCMDSEQAAELKKKLIQMEIEAGLYGQL